MKQTFKKEERLKSRKDIEGLMEGGTAISVSPIKMIWKEAVWKGSIHAKATVAVSKKNFRKAVDRNKLKRRMREAFRKNKLKLVDELQQKNKKINLMFIHANKEMSAYSLIESSIIKTLEKLRTSL